MGVSPTDHLLITTPLSLSVRSTSCHHLLPTNRPPAIVSVITLGAPPPPLKNEMDGVGRPPRDSGLLLLRLSRGKAACYHSATLKHTFFSRPQATKPFLGVEPLGTQTLLSPSSIFLWGDTGNSTSTLLSKRFLASDQRNFSGLPARPRPSHTEPVDARGHTPKFRPHRLVEFPAVLSPTAPPAHTAVHFTK